MLLGDLYLLSMDRIVVQRSGPLAGEVQVPGAKNSVLKLMVASLYSAGTHELNNDLGIIRTNTDLTDWAEQGVLLLNSVLTVRE